MSNLNTHNVHDYASALAWLNGQPNKRGPATLCYATTMRAEGHPSGLDVVVVYHHNTAIIRYYSTGAIEIRTDGYLTSTTVDRLHRMTPSGVFVSRAKGGSLDSPSTGPLDYVPHDWTEVVPNTTI